MTKKVIKISVAGVLIISVLFAAYLWRQRNNSLLKATAQEMNSVRASKGDLEVVLKGSGALSPIEQETISLKVDGTVKKVYFEEGSVVKKGDLLFELEDDELEIGLQKSQLSLVQLQLSLQDSLEQKEKAVVNAPGNGVIKSVNVKPGDSIGSNTVLATMTDPNKSRLRAPFNAAQAKELAVGQRVEVLLLDSIYTVEGKVTKVDSSGTPTSAGGVYYYATIVLEGNYYVEGEETQVQVEVITDKGRERGLGEIFIEPQEVIAIKSEISSKVGKVNIEEGDVVAKGQQLFSLDIGDIDLNIEKQELSLKQGELDLASKQNQRKNLLVYSPIDGTLVEQNLREGELIRPSTNSSSGGTAAVIVNYSKMQVVLPIDELDINKVEIGTPVKITAEALPGEIFSGTVEKIADQGKSQNNVSTFDVTITTEKVHGLKAGMTVDAEIIAAHRQDVLLLPMAAIQYNNDKSFVMTVQGDYGDRQNETKDNRKQPSAMVEVKTGLSNGEYIEILSGINEGDRVMVPSSGNGSNSSRGFGGQMNPMGPVRIQNRPNGRG